MQDSEHLFCRFFKSFPSHNLLFLLGFSIFTLVASFTHAADAPPPEPYPRYDIRVKLNPVEKLLKGDLTLLWTNPSPEPVKELWFHLYMNAFKNTRSTFMKESGGVSRGFRLKEGEWGWIEIESTTVNNQRVSGAWRYVSPDDNNPDDRTVAVLTLPEPLAPHETIKIQLTFTTKLPRVFARTGFHGDFFMVGQWFPKIGVLEVPPQRGVTKPTWNCHQFHANSEFYADYGSYHVEISVPESFVVAATGVEKEHRKRENTVTYIFEQKDVHDFAWSAYPRYKVFEKTFQPDEWISPAEYDQWSRILKVPPARLRLKPVRMILYMQPEHVNQVQRHFKALATALKYFGLWYGAYPYETIRLIDPPYGAGGAGGMEYPTLITAGTSWITHPEVWNPEGVIIHEFGHQYWYGLVGSNEFEESWLDEGFNTYSTGKIIDLAYGPGKIPGQILGIPAAYLFNLPIMTQADFDRIGYLLLPDADPIVRPAWQFFNGLSYGVNSYMRTGVVLRTLENLLGEETMARVMRSYFQTWRFLHPSTHDFINTVNLISGKDMGWFFEQFVFSPETFDIGVESIENRAIGPGYGVFGEGPSRKTRSKKEAIKEKKKWLEEGKLEYESIVTIRRNRPIKAPVKIRITFEDGNVRYEQWDAKDRWVRFRYHGKHKVTKVEVDPEHQYLVDVNFANNSMLTAGSGKFIFKLTSRVAFWLGNMILTLWAFM